MALNESRLKQALGALKDDNLSVSLATLLIRLESESSLLDDISEAELAVLNAVTAGTVAASKAVVVDSNKDAGDFRNVDVTNLDAGASGTAGSVDVFPTTAAKGKLAITCTDQDTDATVSLVA